MLPRMSTEKIFFQGVQTSVGLTAIFSVQGDYAKKTLLGFREYWAILGHLSSSHMWLLHHLCDLLVLIAEGDHDGELIFHFRSTYRNRKTETSSWFLTVYLRGRFDTFIFKKQAVFVKLNKSHPKNYSDRVFNCI